MLILFDEEFWSFLLDFFLLLKIQFLMAVHLLIVIFKKLQKIAVNDKKKQLDVLLFNEDLYQ